MPTIFLKKRRIEQTKMYVQGFVAAAFFSSPPFVHCLAIAGALGPKLRHAEDGKCGLKMVRSCQYGSCIR